jgi:hypothetical protein
VSDCSYRVFERFGIWQWEVVSLSGKMLAQGVADTRPEAVVQAMQSWLGRDEEQGNAIERDATRVGH